MFRMIPIFFSLLAIYLCFRLVFPTKMSKKAKFFLCLLILVSSQCFYLSEMAIGFFSGVFEKPSHDTWRFFYVGQAFFVLLLLLVLFRDLVLLLNFILTKLGLRLPLPNLRSTTSAVFLLLFSFFLGGHAVWEALKVPEVREVSVPIVGLDPRLDGLTIAQISDTHIGAIFGRDWLQAVVDRTNALNPDITVITGDIIDSTPAQVADELPPLRDLKAKYGVFFGVGNHEYYRGLEAWVNYFQSTGMPLLMNSHHVVYVPDANGAPLVVAGITDSHGASARSMFGNADSSSELFAPPDVKAALAGSPPEAMNIVLGHQPKTAQENSRSGVRLQLAGHTHGGLIFPLMPLVAQANGGFVRGLYDVNGMSLYVSPGSGLWGGFPMRLLVPSEITLLTLKAVSP